MSWLLYEKSEIEFNSVDMIGEDIMWMWMNLNVYLTFLFLKEYDECTFPRFLVSEKQSQMSNKILMSQIRK